MKIEHPDGKRTIVMVKDFGLMSEVELYDDYPQASCAIIGGIGYSNCTSVEFNEWDGFMSLIKETDEVVQALKREIPINEISGDSK